MVQFKLIYPSLDNEGVKVTIAKYHTPNDRVIDGIGIKPDVELDLPKGVIHLVQ